MSVGSGFYPARRFANAPLVPVRRGRCPHRPAAPAGAESPRLPLRGRCHGEAVTEGEICHGSAVASSLPCVKAAQCSHWVVRRSVAEVSRPKAVTEGLHIRAGQSPAPTHVYRKPVRHTSGRMWASAPTHRLSGACAYLSERTESSAPTPTFIFPPPLPHRK